MPSRLLLVLFGLCLSVCLSAQDTLATAVISGNYLRAVSSKVSRLDQALDKQSQKILSRLLKEEGKLQRKLARNDSAAAAKVFAQSSQQYDRLRGKLTLTNSLQQYIPSLDTLGSSLQFLRANERYLGPLKNGTGQLQQATAAVTSLQSKFQQAEEIKRFIRERKQYLQQQLDQLGLAQQLKQFNKQAYYYSAQVNEYKQLLKDHKKAERKALELLRNTSLFKEFMRKHSLLAALFRMPGDPRDAAAQASLAGLQTRAQVNSLVQQQLVAGGPTAQAQFSQQMQQAQSQLNELKNKFSLLGGNNGGDLEMPDGFKPNSQRVKSFFQRLELGATIQSQKANGFFPVTSDLALTAGYKLNDKNIIGVGAGYKMGWGKNIRHINVTHEGMSLRGFVDVQLKGSFWLTGGYEWHYRASFSHIEELRDKSHWQQSGLIGLSKVIDLRSKLLKKTKVQLLWDFLSATQLPKNTPISFRIGYSF